MSQLSLTQLSKSTQSDKTQTRTTKIKTPSPLMTMDELEPMITTINGNKSPNVGLVSNRSQGRWPDDSRMDCMTITAHSVVLSSESTESSSLASLKNERGQWDNQMESLLSLVVVLVGYGNLWRFPYLVFTNGGGAFFIPYFIFIVFVGIPIVYLELILGQYSSYGPVGVFRNISPIFRGLGWAVVLTSLIFFVYYNVLTAWSMFYLIESFRAHVPWGHCGQDWNTEGCYSLSKANETCPNGTIAFEHNRCASNKTGPKHSAAEEFFNHKLYSVSSPSGGYGALQLHLCIALLVAWLLVMLCLIRGIRSMGLVVYFANGFIFVTLFVLSIYTSTLDGAGQGIAYFFTPRTEHLRTGRIWISAAEQSVFSLGVGHGFLTTFGSYNRFKNGCFRDALIASLFNTLASVLAGFTLFCVLGFVAQTQGLSLSDFIKNSTLQEGRSLVFVVLAEGFALLPADSVWSILLYILFIVGGVTTLTGTVELIVTALCDEFPILLRRRFFVIMAVCVVAYLFGLPMCLQRGYRILTILDHYTASSARITVALSEICCCVYVYGVNRLISNVVAMLGPATNVFTKILGSSGWFWRLTWLVTCPLALGIMRVISIVSPAQNSSGLTSKEQLAGLLLSSTAFLPLILYASGKLVTTLRRGKKLFVLLKPTDQWCPLHQRRRAEAESVITQATASLDLRQTEGTQTSSDTGSVSSNVINVSFRD